MSSLFSYIFVNRSFRIQGAVFTNCPVQKKSCPSRNWEGSRWSRHVSFEPATGKTFGPYEPDCVINSERRSQPLPRWHFYPRGKRKRYFWQTAALARDNCRRLIGSRVKRGRIPPEVASVSPEDLQPSVTAKRIIMGDNVKIFNRCRCLENTPQLSNMITPL